VRVDKQLAPNNGLEGVMHALFRRRGDSPEGPAEDPSAKEDK
jgi:hypothetical protein